MALVFITGDRSVPAGAAAGLVNLVLLKEIVQTGAGVNGSNGVEFATGTEKGVEAAVRFAAEATGLPVLTFETPTVEGHDNWKDFAQRAKNVLAADPAARFLVMHGDPQSSRITKALFDTVPEAQIEVVAPQFA